MPNSQIVVAYAAQAFSQSAASVSTLLSAIALKYGLPRTVALFPSADATTTAMTTVTRKITFKMGSKTTQTTNIGLDANTAASPIRNVGLTGGVHTDYAAPPIVSFTDTGNGSGAKASAIMGVGATVMFANGSGYNPATTKVTLANGQLDPNGTPAVLTPIIVAGAFNGVTIVSPGSGYNRFPDLVIVDPSGGTGAVGIMSLKPVSIRVWSGGTSYSGPTMTLTPAFIERCPDSGDQAGMIEGWMGGILAQGTGLAIQEIEPVVS